MVSTSRPHSNSLQLTPYPESAKAGRPLLALENVLQLKHTTYARWIKNEWMEIRDNCLVCFFKMFPLKYGRGLSQRTLVRLKCNWPCRNKPLLLCGSYSWKEKAWRPELHSWLSSVVCLVSMLPHSRRNDSYSRHLFKPVRIFAEPKVYDRDLQPLIDLTDAPLRLHSRL